MYSEIKAFVQEQERQIGIAISVFADDCTLIAGEGELLEFPDCKDVISNAEQNKTYFPISCRGKNFVGVIDGAEQSQHVYATLLKSLAENSLSKDRNLSKDDFFRRVVFGETDYVSYRRFSEKFGVPQTSCVAMLITMPDGRLSEIKEILANYGNSDTDCIIKLQDNECVFIKFIDEESQDYRSVNEYAQYLALSVYDESGVQISISIGGTARTPFELPASFAQAVSAVRMGAIMGKENGVHSFQEYVLIKILEDLPKHKLNEYFKMLSTSEADEIFNDSEMIETANVFLDNNLNISETARILFLHRNTLTYRLDKIEKATGLNVRKFSDAITFRLITILMKLNK